MRDRGRVRYSDQGREREREFGINIIVYKIQFFILLSTLSIT